MSDKLNCIQAEFPDEGINQFIKDNERKLTTEAVECLREWRTKIFSENIDTTNIMIVIYSGNESYKIKIGKGEKRKVIDLSQCKKQSETQSDSRTVKISRHDNNDRNPNDIVESAQNVFGAGLGAVGTAGVYVGLVANPATAPLMLIATGGAMVGSLLMQKDKKIHSERTYTVECPVDQIDKATGILKQLEY